MSASSHFENCGTAIATASTVRGFFGMGNFPTASDAATSSNRDKTAHRFSTSTIIVAPRPTADSKRANGYAQMTNDRYSAWRSQATGTVSRTGRNQKTTRVGTIYI